MIDGLRSDTQQAIQGCSSDGGIFSSAQPVCGQMVPRISQFTTKVTDRLLTKVRSRSEPLLSIITNEMKMHFILTI